MFASKLGYIWKTGLQFASRVSSKITETAAHLQSTRVALHRGSSALFPLVVPNFAPNCKIVEANLVVGGPLCLLSSRRARGLDG